MHPQQQLGIGGPVGPAAARLHTVDARVHPAYPRGRAVGGVRAPIGDRADIVDGPPQASPRVVPIGGVMGDTGHGQRVHRLQEQRPDPGDDHARVAVYPPGHAGRSEQADIPVRLRRLCARSRARVHPMPLVSHSRILARDVMESNDAR